MCSRNDYESVADEEEEDTCHIYIALLLFFHCMNESSPFRRIPKGELFYLDNHIFLNTSDALCPPKPRELLIAYWMSAFLALLTT